MPSPADSDQAMDRVLRALADATRRTLLDRLRDRPGLTQGELAAGIAITRQALSKHLQTLEDAALVATRWRGREKLHYLNPAPLQALPARWITGSAQETRAALSVLQSALADTPPAADGDAVARALAEAPGAALNGGAVATPEALAQARRYAEGTARAVGLLLATLDDGAAYRRPAAGGFSLAEHLWHLADLETLGWSVRFQRLLAEERPRLPGVDGDRLARESRYQERPWRGAARRFIAHRRRTLRTLGHLDAAALLRPAVFAGRRSSAGDVLAALVAHDAEHRGQMLLLWNARGDDLP